MIDSVGGVVMREGDQRDFSTSKRVEFYRKGPMWGSSTPQRVGGVQSHHPWLSEIAPTSHVTGTSQV